MNRMNNKGFTLIESVVVMAIISIVSTMLYAGVALINNQYGIMTHHVDYDRITSNMLNVFVQYTRYAEEVSFDEIEGGWMIDVEDNTVYQIKEGEKRVLFSDEYFEGCTVDLSFEQISSNNHTLRIAVDLYDEEECVYSSSTYVRLLNMELYGKSIGIAQRQSSHLYFK